MRASHSRTPTPTHNTHTSRFMRTHFPSGQEHSGAVHVDRWQVTYTHTHAHTHARTHTKLGQRDTNMCSGGQEHAGAVHAERGQVGDARLVGFPLEEQIRAQRRHRRHRYQRGHLWRVSVCSFLIPLFLFCTSSLA